MITTNLKNPSVIILPDAKDLDLAIQKIQTELGALAWLEKVFGRAKEISRKYENETRREPMVYQGSKEYYPVLPNDALKSFSFFRTGSSRSANDYVPNSYKNYFTTPTDLIVWCNLKRIDGSKDYIFTEELIRDVMSRLKRCPDVEVLRIWDDRMEDVYRGYSLQPTHRDLVMYPYQAFRIEMNLKYAMEC